MTTFPARVIAEYERTGNEIIGRALEKAKWVGVPGEQWVNMEGLAIASDATEVLDQSLAYCLLMELELVNWRGVTQWLEDSCEPDGLLTACIEAGRSE